MGSERASQRRRSRITETTTLHRRDDDLASQRRRSRTAETTTSHRRDDNLALAEIGERLQQYPRLECSEANAVQPRILQEALRVIKLLDDVLAAAARGTHQLWRPRAERDHVRLVGLPKLGDRQAQVASVVRASRLAGEQVDAGVGRGSARGELRRREVAV